MDEIQNIQLLTELKSDISGLKAMVEELKTDVKEIKVILNGTKIDVIVLKSQNLNDRVTAIESFKWVVIGGLTVGQIAIGIVVNIALKYLF